MSLQPNSEHPILLVDDEPNALETFVFALKVMGISNVLKCRDESTVMDILGEKDIDVVLLDIIMPKRSGESLLEENALKYPDIPVIMVTGMSDIQTAVRCMRKGAFDYLTKPVDTDHLAISIRRAMDHRLLKRKENLLLHHILTESLKSPEAFSSIITQDRKMLSLFMYCEAVAPCKRTCNDHRRDRGGQGIIRKGDSSGKRRTGGIRGGKCCGRGRSCVLGYPVRA